MKFTFATSLKFYWEIVFGYSNCFHQSIHFINITKWEVLDDEQKQDPFFKIDELEEFPVYMKGFFMHPKYWDLKSYFKKLFSDKTKLAIIALVSAICWLVLMIVGHYNTAVVCYFTTMAAAVRVQYLRNQLYKAMREYRTQREQKWQEYVKSVRSLN